MGLIARRRRGMIAVLDTQGLEDVACECYRKVRDYNARFFNLDAPV